MRSQSIAFHSTNSVQSAMAEISMSQEADNDRSYRGAATSAREIAGGAGGVKLASAKVEANLSLVFAI